MQAKDRLHPSDGSKSKSPKQSKQEPSEPETPQTLSNHRWIHPSPYIDDEDDSDSLTREPSPEVKKAGETVANSIQQLESINNQIQDVLSEIEKSFTKNAQTHKQRLIQSFKRRLNDAARETAAEEDEGEGDTSYWIKKFKESEQGVTYLRMEMERIHRLNETLSRELKRKTDSYQESREENAQLEIQLNKVCFDLLFPSYLFYSNPLAQS